ncbi:hypothetical protein QVD17_39351 [Tagetes erecta]|uniref:Uncharacterized protein n=1 Tax=Tagetes erecta TaxID=13708 RepID=A0AAD8JS43_TARER|nr:hypothetical protein QVD17_39351 [Tagetes erecta]
MKDNGTYDPSKTDVVTEVVGKGHQHGGSTRLYCDVIGFTKSLFPESESKKKKTEAIDTAVAKSSNIRGLSHALVTNYQKLSLCKNVNFYGLMANARLWL